MLISSNLLRGAPVKHNYTKHLKKIGCPVILGKIFEAFLSFEAQYIGGRHGP